MLVFTVVQKLSLLGLKYSYHKLSHPFLNPATVWLHTPSLSSSKVPILSAVAKKEVKIAAFICKVAKDTYHVLDMYHV